MGEASTKVNVRFFGLLDEVPESHVTLELAGEAALIDVLHHLAAIYGKKLGDRLLQKNGHLPEDIKLVIGTEVIDHLDHKIENNTTLFIMSQFAGGSGEPA